MDPLAILGTEETIERLLPDLVNFNDVGTKAQPPPRHVAIKKAAPLTANFIFNILLQLIEQLADRCGIL